MILRFMGDLREPAPQEEPPKEEAPKGLRKKLSTLGRKSLSEKNKLIVAAGGTGEGAGGLEPEEDEEQSQVSNQRVKEE